MAHSTVSSTLAVDIPQLVSGDLALIDNTCRKNTTIAEAELSAAAETVPAPFNAGYLRFTKRRNGDALSIVWCAEQGGEPVLMVGYDSTRIGRELVDCIVAARFGVPDEVEEMAL